MSSSLTTVWLAVCCYGGMLVSLLADNLPDGSSSDLEFFEKRIRPVLAEHCYRCHSAQAEKVKGGLLLDSKPGLTKGGDGGPVLVPGHPEQSRLIEAVLYSNPDLQMPPKGKLRDEQIADLEAWIKRDAPWPVETTSGGAADAPNPFHLQERRQRHWAWKPIQVPAPSASSNSVWSTHPVDRFIQDGLNRSKLSPAPDADGWTLLRRISFDLRGLPPSAGELADWRQDTSTDAWTRVVDRMLESPAFGERWARHWLDLVRYSETLGHEFDYTNPNAWRYRDYVIRAFNSDLPYDQFLREQVAGDLLAKPRRHPTEGYNESIIGPAIYWLGQRDHSPVDIRQHQAELIDNQIDVLTKTFLGLTVACARCHDHKFDAIPTQDYYSLYAILSSSRYTQAAIDSPRTIQDQVGQIRQIKDQLRQAIGRRWTEQAERTADYLRAAEALRQNASLAFELDPTELEAMASTWSLEPRLLERWWQAIAAPSRDGADDWFSAWNRSIAGELTRPAANNGPLAPSTLASTPDTRPPPPTGLATSSITDFPLPQEADTGWFFEGEAFPRQPAAVGDFMLPDKDRPELQLIAKRSYHSGLISRRLQGTLRSPTFTITQRYIHIYALGRDTRINVPVDNFTMIRDPIYGGLKRVLNHEDFRWITIDVGMWIGHRAYLEFSDVSVADPSDDPRRFGPAGYLALERISFSDSATAPLATPLPSRDQTLTTTDGLARAQSSRSWQKAVTRAVAAWSGGVEVTPEEADLLNAMVSHGLLEAATEPAVNELFRKWRETESAIPDPVRVLSMTDGTGLDETVFVRGNHRLTGAPAPRRFLQAIAGSDQPAISSGSGRLQLAERMLAETNPFVARVMVNRVWLHLFGRGLVATPDDFGELGQKPTHPELLDWLANWYRTEGGWSTKRLIRLLVTSRAYRMGSRPDSIEAEQRDPDNLLWHRMPLRRLEGESIRDAILTVSSRLDPQMYGPPVPIHLTDFMDGRGRPTNSGPLDGAGRRSIYVEVRRNFISPMMRTFDQPVPFTTIGRRTVSNVPAQSLILMNDPFVRAEAMRWAEAILSDGGRTPEQRIAAMYQRAFSRPADPAEIRAAMQFLQTQANLYDSENPSRVEPRVVWSDLAHVLFNVKEFVFLN